GFDDPAHLVAREAERRAAALVLTGLRGRGVVGHLTHDETALRVMRPSARRPLTSGGPAARRRWKHATRPLTATDGDRGHAAPASRARRRPTSCPTTHGHRGRRRRGS